MAFIGITFEANFAFDKMGISQIFCQRSTSTLDEKLITNSPFAIELLYHGFLFAYQKYSMKVG